MALKCKSFQIDFRWSENVKRFPVKIALNSIERESWVPIWLHLLLFSSQIWFYSSIIFIPVSSDRTEWRFREPKAPSNFSIKLGLVWANLLDTITLNCLKKIFQVQQLWRRRRDYGYLKYINFFWRYIKLRLCKNT